MKNTKRVYLYTLVVIQLTTLLVSGQVSTWGYKDTETRYYDFDKIELRIGR